MFAFNYMPEIQSVMTEHVTVNIVVHVLKMTVDIICYSIPLCMCFLELY